MRVLYVSEQFGVHDRRFLSAISEAGHQPFFVCVGRSQQPLDMPPNVTYVGGDVRQGLAATRADLLHAGPLHTGGYLAAQTRFHPFVAMSWGSDILYTARRNPFARRRVATALGAADALIADCAAVADAAASMGFSRESISIFPWGVDLTQFNPHTGDDGLRQRLGWQDAFVLLHLRAWEPLYGSETVLRAFLQLAPGEPRLRLLMPGAGRLNARFKKLVAHSGFEDRIYLPGSVAQADLPPYYSAADLYVSASHSDGSSVSLMEALACGVPVLVSDIPGNREWVQPRAEGWLFPAGNQAALADKIVAAMKAPNLTDLGGNARRKAETRADWDSNKLGLTRAYELALS